MKRTPIYLATILMLVTLTGCEELRFSQYTGEHKAWPTGSSLSEKVFAVPVFRGWPEKPYEVLGYIEFNQPGIDWNQGDIKQAARKAQEAGGDAILMVAGRDVTSPTLVAMRTDLGINSSETIAVVLKWK